MEEIILKYYDFVDKKNFMDLFNLFTEDIVYKRGEKTFYGINELKTFYLKDRKLDWNHNIESIYKIKEDYFISKWVFSWKNWSGEEIKVAFTEHIYIDLKESKIKLRETYLLNWYNLIK